MIVDLLHLSSLRLIVRPAKLFCPISYVLNIYSNNYPGEDQSSSYLFQYSAIMQSD